MGKGKMGNGHEGPGGGVRSCLRIAVGVLGTLNTHRAPQITPRLIPAMPTLRFLSRIPFNAWLLLIGVPLAIFWTDFFPSQQMRNIEAGRKHAAILKSLLQRDSRYAKVIPGVWTGGGGEMLIRGELSSMADLEELKKIIQASQPPVSVSVALNAAGKSQAIRLPASSSTPPP